MNKAVFSQPWGGLGDNLSFSNLPALYYELGIKFYLSAINNCRNTAIKEICWDNNQYVKKPQRLIPNIGYKVMLKNNFHLSDKKFNIIQNINCLHGFKPGNGLPEINLKYLKEPSSIKFDLMLDLNASSLFSETKRSYNIESLSEALKDYQSGNALDIIYPNLYTNKIPLSKNSNFEINSIHQLIDVLKQTNIFVCLNSGSHVLASAVKELTGLPNKIISFNSVDDENLSIKNGKIEEKFGSYYFDNVEYIKITTENIQSSDEFKNNIDNHASKTDYYKKLHALFFNPVETFSSFLINKLFKK